MSDYICDECRITNQDSPRGYTAGCQHNPPHNTRDVLVDFGGNTYATMAFYFKPHGAWYRSVGAKAGLRPIHPVAWREK